MITNTQGLYNIGYAKINSKHLIEIIKTPFNYMKLKSI